MILSIEKAEYINGYKFKIFFSDGVSKIVDFEDFLKKSKNPMTKKYLDLNLFKKFKIKYGDLEWNNYELCFPIWDLHKGVIK